MWHKMAPQLALLLFITVAVQATVTYEGRSVYRLEYAPENVERMRDMINGLQVDVWGEGKGHVDVMLPKHHKAINFPINVISKTTRMIDDVQEAIDAQRNSLPAFRSSRAIDSTTYRDYDTLLGELEQLEADFPDLVSSYEIGTTFEGRALKVIALSSGQVPNAPVVWLDCGIHAREWVSHATCMYVLDQLTSGYGSDDIVNALLAAYDFHVLPITNPDGYVHSWNADRLWRKNRVPYGACFGADVNRNFDSNFGGEGASDLACADTYHGPSAFSEAESAAIRDALIALGSRVKAVFTLHAYSQYWMFPYGAFTDLPADYDELNRVSALAVEALTAVHGTSYVYGNIADVIYVASGGSVDYTYDALGITYSYAVELRDQGQYGFLLPANQIIPTAEEFFAGFYTAIQNFQ